MDSLPCHRCHRPATLQDAGGRDWCMACVAAEAARRLPFAKVACEALERLGHSDLAREVRRRQDVVEQRLPFDDTPPYVELVQ